MTPLFDTTSKWQPNCKSSGTSSTLSSHERSSIGVYLPGSLKPFSFSQKPRKKQKHRICFQRSRLTPIRKDPEGMPTYISLIKLSISPMSSSSSFSFAAISLFEPEKRTAISLFGRAFLLKFSSTRFFHQPIVASRQPAAAANVPPIVPCCPTLGHWHTDGKASRLLTSGISNRHGIQTPHATEAPKMRCFNYERCAKNGPVQIINPGNIAHSSSTESFYLDTVAATLPSMMSLNYQLSGSAKPIG